MTTIAHTRRRRNPKEGAAASNGEIPVYATHRGHRIVVGGMIQTADGTWLLKKRVSLKKHKLTKPGAIGWSVEVLAQARTWGCTAIQVTDRDSGDVYSASMEHFLERSVLIERNGNEDPQRALALHHWRVNGHLSEFEQLAQRQVARDEQPRQMALLEVFRYE